MTTKEELRARIAQLEQAQMQAAALYQISRDLAAARNEEELLQILAWPTMETEASRVSLMYIDLDPSGEPEWAKTVASWDRQDTTTTAAGTRYHLPEYPLARLWMADPYEPQLISDVTADERVDEEILELLIQDNDRALATIPMSQAGQWVGLAFLSWNEPHEFGEEEKEIYRALTGLLPPVVHNRRLLIERERSVIEKLYEISRNLNVANSEDDLLQALAQPAVEAGASGANLAYIDLDEDGEPEWGKIVAAWQREGPPPAPVGTRYYLPATPSAHTWLSHPEEPVLITDVVTDTDEREDKNLNGMPVHSDASALAIIPLTLAGRWVGLVTLYWDEPHEFSEQEVEIYNALISMAAPAVEGQRLAAEAHARAEELAALNELGQVLTTRLDVEGVLEEAYRQASRLVDTTNFYLALYDPDENEVILAIDVIEGDLTKPYVTWKNRQGFAEYVIRNREPIIAQDTYTDWADEKGVGVHKRVSLSGKGVRVPLSVLAVPMVVGEEVLGMIAVRDYDDPRAYDEHDKKLLSAIASQTAIALQNAQLFDNLERMVEQRTAELRESVEEKTRLQQEIIEAQQRAIQELSTPVIPIMERIIVMPLIGSIDTMRAKDITRSLLRGIGEHRAKVVILDITGVPIVDSGVADYLNKTIQAARLKGARTIVTGISDAVAETIVDLGIDWSGIETLADLQTGLIAALNSLGIRLTREHLNR